MTAFAIETVIRASALLAAAALVDLFLRRRASAAVRHLLWTLTVAALLVLPIASVGLPVWRVRIPVPARADAADSRAEAAAAVSLAAVPAPVSTAPVRASTPERIPRLTPTVTAGALAALYAAGVLVLFARLVLEPFAVRRLTRASREVTDPAWRRLLAEASRSMVGTRRGIRLLQTSRDVMPLTFGTLAPVVVLPASADAWTPDRRRTVLLHELAHVSRADCLIQRLTACVCALYWPHPGVWYAARRLRAERELACDDRVIAAGAAPRDYAGHLLEIAHAFRATPAPAAALGMTRARQLERRLLAILDEARDRTSIGRGRLSVMVGAAFLAFVPIAVLRAVLVPADLPQTMAPSAQIPAPPAGASATQEFTGTWEVHPSERPGQVQLTIRRGRSTHGRTLPLADLERLAGTTLSAAATVRFPIRRDAGTFTVDGTCRSGACAGTFVFEPSATFAAELSKRGIGRPTPEDQFHLAVGDIGIAYLDALSAAGYRTPDVHTLVRAAQHGVDLGYLREMTALGYRFGAIEDLIRLRDHGVDPEYVRGMASNGLAKLSADELVRARDHGVDPEYVRGLSALGLGNLALDDLVRARDHGVDPEYVRGMQASGYKGLSLDALVGARDHGVDPEYTRAMADLGYKGVPLESLVRMRDHGVDPAYVRRLQQRGVTNLTVEELIRRRDRGDDR